MPKPTTHPKAPWWPGSGFMAEWAFIKPADCHYELIPLDNPPDGWVRIISACAIAEFHRRYLGLRNKPPHTDPERARKRAAAMEEAGDWARAWEVWYDEWRGYWNES